MDPDLASVLSAIQISGTNLDVWVRLGGGEQVPLPELRCSASLLRVERYIQELELTRHLVIYKHGDKKTVVNVVTISSG